MNNSGVSATDPLLSPKINIDQERYVSLLGGFQLQLGDKAIHPEDFRLRRACSLVKLLALAPGHRITRDQVLEWLWPEGDPRASANNLHQTLRSARQVLEALQPPWRIRFEDEVLTLYSNPPFQVDVEAFEAAAALARQSKDPAFYNAALSLYTGELLPEDRYEDWAIQRRKSLQQTYLDLLLELARLYEARGEHSPAVVAYQQLTSVDPLQEEAQTGLMRVYALSGQRSQALRQYQILQDTLFKELGAEPDPAVKMLYQQILAGKYSAPDSLTQVSTLPTPTQEVVLHNLPAQLTSFIGRQQDIIQVKELVTEHRLVTLTGSGGVGKTRLASKVAEEILESFPNGVWLVELASISNPEQVPQACAQVLGIFEKPDLPPLTRLIQYLEKKQLLLLLDNCEHMISACAFLADALLKACPRLHILATSRETLSLPGEALFRVPTLNFPDPHSWPPLEKLGQYEAVHLFVDRAAQVSPGMALNEKNAGAVVRICQRLDGIPLAIELAAARARMMSVEQISDRLEDVFHLLTDGNPAALPRQQTLRASIDWSYQLLSSQEKQLLQNLSVFAGGWTLEAAEAMWTDSPDWSDTVESNRLIPPLIIDWLAQLVDKSLVVMQITPNQPRYHLLDTIQQYALEKLRETGGEAARRDQHLDYFTFLAKQASPHLRSRGMVGWLDRLEPDLDNLRTAMEWSMEPQSRAGNIEQGLQIAADLLFFWWVRGFSMKPIELLKRLLACEADERGDQPIQGNRSLQRARALRILYHLGHDLIENTGPLIQESVSLLRSLEPSNRRELGISLFYTWYFSSSRPPEIEQEFLEIFHQENETFYLAEYLYYLGSRSTGNEEILEARRYLEESLAICRQVEDIDGIALRTLNLSEFALFEEDYPRARVLVQEVFELNRGLKHWWFEGYGRVYLSEIACAEGKYAEATQYAAEALSLFREINWKDGIRRVLRMEALKSWSMGDFEHAKAITLELMEMPLGIHDFQGIGSYLLGRIALTLGGTDKAEILLKQSLSMVDERTWIYRLAPLLAGIVVLYSKQDKMREAARLAGKIDATLKSVFPGLTPRERGEYGEAMDSTRAALRDEIFSAAWEAGKALHLEQAIQDH